MKYFVVGMDLVPQLAAVNTAFLVYIVNLPQSAVRCIKVVVRANLTPGKAILIVTFLAALFGNCYLSLLWILAWYPSLRGRIFMTHFEVN